MYFILSMLTVDSICAKVRYSYIYLNSFNGYMYSILS